MIEEDRKEKTISAEWHLEDYLYHHNFSIERVGLYFTEMFYKGELLAKPEFLFKFYNKSNLSIDALLEGYLYFANPRSFNDPFDCITNREKYITNNGSALVKHRDEIGVCCFSTINDNPLMWGHYTNNYTGFCLKFKNDSLIRNLNVHIKSHVAYLKNYLPTNENLNLSKKEICEFDIDTELKNRIIGSLTLLNEYCWKYYDWKYENEFRAISINSSEFDRKLKFEKEDLLEIYIGHKMKITDPNFYNLLLYILKNEYPNIKIYIVEPHPLIVKLEFQKI